MPILAQIQPSRVNRRIHSISGIPLCSLDLRTRISLGATSVTFHASLRDERDAELVVPFTDNRDRVAVARLERERLAIDEYIERCLCVHRYRGPRPVRIRVDVLAIVDVVRYEGSCVWISTVQQRERRVSRRVQAA